MDKGETRLILQ